MSMSSASRRVPDSWRSVLDTYGATLTLSVPGWGTVRVVPSGLTGVWTVHRPPGQRADALDYPRYELLTLLASMAAAGATRTDQ